MKEYLIVCGVHKFHKKINHVGTFPTLTFATLNDLFTVTGDIVDNNQIFSITKTC